MISIVIPTYNVELLIKRTLLSIINQRNAPEFEIIIVDDCSTDATVKTVESFAQEYPNTNIILLHQEKNMGPAAARNHGMYMAHGDYLAYLDGDDYWEPDFLYKTVSFLNEHSEAVAVFTGQHHMTIRNPNSIRPRCLLNSSQPFKKPIILDDFFSFWSAERYLVCTGSIVIRTKLLFELRGQRDDLRICEDLELWCLIGLYGKIGFIPEVLFTSDGMKSIGRKGLWLKLKQRFNSIPTMENWQKRHIELIGNNEMSNSYFLVCNEIAQNLANAMIMAKQYDDARNTIIKYGSNFPDRRYHKLAFLCRNRGIWFVVATLIRFRGILHLMRQTN